MSKVKPIPDGYHSITPYLVMNDAAKAIEFYKKAFGAIETVRMSMPNGRVGHAELKMGDSVIMLADESPEVGAHSPQTIGGSPVSILFYVEDVDKVVKQASDAGAKITRPTKDQFYGDRSAMLTDPFGHQWSVATHIEDVTPEEMKKRMAAVGAK